MSLTACAHCGKHPILEHTLEDRIACRKAHRAAYERIRKQRLGYLDQVKLYLDTGEQRLLPMGQALQRLGVSEGGVKAHATGAVRTHFTPERARELGLRRKRDRHGQIIRRKSVSYHNRAAIRAQFTGVAKLGYEYHPEGLLDDTTGTLTGVPVWTITDDWGTRVMREQTVLTRLGYLRKHYLKSTGAAIGIEPVVGVKKP